MKADPAQVAHALQVHAQAILSGSRAVMELANLLENHVRLTPTQLRSIGSSMRRQAVTADTLSILLDAEVEFKVSCK